MATAILIGIAIIIFCVGESNNEQRIKAEMKEEADIAMRKQVAVMREQLKKEFNIR